MSITEVQLQQAQRALRSAESYAPTEVTAAVPIPVLRALLEAVAPKPEPAPIPVTFAPGTVVLMQGGTEYTKLEAPNAWIGNYGNGHRQVLNHFDHIIREDLVKGLSVITHNPTPSN